MGNIQTNISRSTLTAFTEHLNTNITQINNTVSANCVSGNILTLNIGGAKCPYNPVLENVNIKSWQEAKADCELNAEFVSQINIKIENQIENIVKSFIEQDLKNNQGFFALAFSGQTNIATQTQDVSNRIANYVKNNIDTFCGASAIATNEQTINICAQLINSTINPTQNATATAYVNCVSNTVIEAFIKDSTLNDLATKASQKSDSKQEGFGSILIYLIIAAAIIAVIAVIGFIIYLVISSRKSGGSGTTINVPPQLAQVAALGVI